MIRDPRKQDDVPETSTSDQLRSDIDHGRTRDKVNFPDPAAAPLGTDEEAAGTPVSGKDVSAARRAERGVPTPAAEPRARLDGYLAGLGVLIVLGIGLLIWIAVRQ